MLPKRPRTPMYARFATSLVVLLLVSLFAGRAPAHAQNTLTLDSLEVELWPEFDLPQVLVLVNGTLPADAPLPATVTLNLPAEPFAVAERATDGRLFNAEYVTATVGSETAVTLTLQQPAFRLEYYDATLTRTGDTRQYTFQWTATLPARSASIRVQSPPGAAELQLQPNFGPAAPGEYGLNYYTTELGAVAAGQTLTAQVSYTKPDTTLTIEQVNAEPQPAPINITAPPPTVDYTPWIIGAVTVAGLGVLGGGVAWFWRSQSTARAPAKHHRSRKANVASTAVHSANGVNTAPRFCTQCGQSLASSDRFCRQCGTPVQVG